MSNDAYRIVLMNRALARSDAELHGFRANYEAVARSIAARLIAGKAK
jgi:hypothetical protein